MRWCAWATKNARSYSFLAVFLVTFLSVQKSNKEKNSEMVFLPNSYDDHMAFQMLTA